MKTTRFIVLLAFSVLTLQAQKFYGIIGLGNVDMSGADTSKPARLVSSDPGTCAVGEKIFNTTSAVFKSCLTADNWTIEGAGSSGSGAVFLTTTSSSGTTYTATASGYSSYSNGDFVIWDVGSTACTGSTSTTMNIQSIGAKRVYRYDGTSNPLSTDCPASANLLMVYDTALTSSAGGWRIVGGSPWGTGDMSLGTAQTSTQPKTFTPTSTTAGIIVTCTTLPSSPSNGSIACDSADSNKLKVRSGGAWITIVDAGGGSGDMLLGTSQTVTALKIFTPTTTTAGIRVACTALPNTPANGDLACDSADSNKVKVYSNGSWITVASGGSSAAVAGELTDFNIGGLSTGTLSIGSSCTSGHPCSVRFGSSYQPLLVAASTATISGFTGAQDIYIYGRMNGSTSECVFGSDSATIVIASGACVPVTGVTGFPKGSVPLWVCSITNTTWDSACVDARGWLSVSEVIAGAGLGETYLNGKTTLSVNSPIRTRSIVFPFNGNGSALSTNDTFYQVVPFDCEIKSWNIQASPSGTATVKFWLKSTGGTAIPTSSDSISISTGAVLSTGTYVHSTALTDFSNVIITQDAQIAATLTAVSTATKLTVTLGCLQQ